jgi:FdrA protein
VVFKRLVIKPNSYHDSIVLMRLARTVRNIDKVVAAQVGMATELNKDAVREMGFVSQELETATAGKGLCCNEHTSTLRSFGRYR